MGQARGLLVTRPQSSKPTLQTMAFHASWTQINFHACLRRWFQKNWLPKKNKGCRKINFTTISFLYTCQENGADLPVQALRAVLQHIESKGFVDFTLGGHSCARPPAVQQGKAPDSFVIAPDANNPLVWRPQLIQQKNLKPANIASHFQYGILKASPLVLVPWFYTKSVLGCFPRFFL